MRFLSTALSVLVIASPALAQTQPDYLDDRSTAEQVVRSLYNAINRQEYLRAWTYYSENNRPDLGNFKAGYVDTANVALALGTVMSDGAAGTIYWQVPVAITATDTDTDGTAKTFAGCYTLYQPQPAIQEVPPFAPIAIKSGALKPVTGSLDESVPGSC